MARQPLLKGGSLWNLNSAAGTSEEIAKLDVVKVEQDVLYDVLEAFLSTFVLQERKAVFERQVKEQERLLRRARQWTGMGTEARMVVLQFQTQLAAYEAEVLTSGAALSRQSVQLLSLIGDREAQELRLEGGLDIAQQLILDVTKLGLPTERPEFRQAELRVQYAEANQVIQMASHWPSLSLFASAGRQGSQRSNLFDADYTSWRAGIQLDVPLFSGLSSFAERSRYASTLAQARVQESKQRDTSVRDRVQAEQNYEASRVLLEARRKVVDAAREAHRLGTSLYTNGAIPYTQFAEADRRVVEAEVAYNEIRRDHALNIASMYRAGNRSLRELIPQR
jgi:outer membrane protein TolC